MIVELTTYLLDLEEYFEFMAHTFIQPQLYKGLEWTVHEAETEPERGKAARLKIKTGSLNLLP
jgi:hypothetical protein